jgi:ABC-2 type transport system ATP-binding protein
MRDLLRQLKSEGMSIFLNSHQLADVEALCDRVAIINEGRILKVGAPQSLFDEAPVFEVRANPVNKELLHRLGSIALAVRQDEDDPCVLYIEVQKDEQAADIAEIIHACGSRLYGLTPHHRSLEQLFLRTIDASRQRAPVESTQL